MKEYNSEKLSSNFYRLVKKIDTNVNSVYEFHTVIRNKNKYINQYEEIIGEDGSIGLGYIEKRKKIGNIDFGNKEYKRLKSLGYKFDGIYQMDIYGYKNK